MAAQILKVALDASKALLSVRSLVSGFGSVKSGAQEATSQINSMVNPLSQIKGLLMTLGAGASIKGLIDVADQYTEMGNKIRGVVKDQAEFNDMQGKIFDAANRSRTSLQATTDLFSKMATSMQGMGKSNADALKLTETIQKLGKVGGMSKQSVEAGIYQFSQAMSSGVLQGDELRSVRENMPALARAIADGMGVSIGKLKEMGSQGKLTADEVVKALEKAGPRLSKTFDNIPQTFGEAMEFAKNHWVRFVGEMSKESGLVDYFGLITKKVSEMMFGVGTDSKAMAKNIGDFVIDIFERLSIGVARVIDMSKPVFGFLKKAIGEFDQAWSSLPGWAQEAGVAGAILFGKDFAMKGATVITVMNWILKKFDTSIGELLGESVDKAAAATEGTRGLLGNMLYGDEGTPDAATNATKKFFAELRADMAKIKKDTESTAGFGINMQKKQTIGPDEKEVKKYENILQRIRQKVDPYNFALQKQKDEEKDLTELLKNKNGIMKAVGVTQGEVNELIRKSKEYWAKQNDVVGNSTKTLEQQEKVLAANINSRDALNASLTLQEQILQRKGKLENEDIARLAEYTRRYQAYIDATKLDSYKEGAKSELEGMDDEIAAMGLVGKARERQIYLRQLERDSIRQTGALQTTTINQLMEKYDELQRKYDSSRTASLGFSEAIDDYMTRVRDIASATRDAMSSVFSSLEDKLAEFIRTGKFSFKDFVSVINNELSKIAAQQLIGLGMNLAGFRAEGGPVTGGKTYVVGERGPELFTAPFSGNIIPNHQLQTKKSSGSQLVFSPTISIQGNGVTMAEVQSALNQSKSDMAAWVADEMRSGGLLN